MRRTRLLAGIVLVAVISLFSVLCTGSVSAALPDNQCFQKTLEMLRASVALLESGCMLESFNRRNLIDDVYEYELVLKVGPGAFDKIGAHRVVKEKAPWVPSEAATGLMMVHGSASNFQTAFLMSTLSPSVAPDQSIGVFLAQKGVDVWGIDLRWTFVPDDQADFSFMREWDTAMHVRDLKIATKLARALRGMTGSGFGKMFMLGHSLGAQIAYAYANAETLLPGFRWDLAGIIPVDIVIRFDPAHADLIGAAGGRLAAFQLLFDSGVYCSDEGFKLRGLAMLAQMDPDGPSPVIDGFTNKQAALFALSATWATYNPLEPPTPPYHYMAGVFDDYGMPTGLQFTDYHFALDIASAVPGFESLRALMDGEAMMSGIETPYNNNFSRITIPVLYVGAAGGFGQYGVYTTSLLGSTDVCNLIVRLYPPGAEAVDYGHADLFWATGDPNNNWGNARDLVWQPVYDWLDTRSRQ